MRFRIAVGLLLLSLSATAAESPPPAISLLTFAPGEVYWQRFGHNALLVRDAQGARVYNYGMFDFRQKNFFLNFARGRMLYRLDVQPLWWNLDLYRGENRSVREQVLNLTPSQATELAAFLDTNARPENAEYRYDYFRDNCSTRVRDALDATLGGGLRRELEQRPTPFSYRHEAVRLISPDTALALGMDVLLGPPADTPLSLWQQSFVPMALMQAVRGITVTDAAGTEQPLVRGERVLVPEPAADATPQAPPVYLAPLLVAGLLLGGLLWLLPHQRHRVAARVAFAVLALSLSLFSGVFGLIQLLGWTLTEHWAMAANPNQLLFTPLTLVLLPTWARSARADWPVQPWQKKLGLVIALFAPLAVLGGQTNLHWLVFWLPVHFALMRALRR